METSEMHFQTTLIKSIVDIATEEWRFRRIFEKAMQKLEIDEQKKYISQYLWFTKQVNIALENAGLRIIDLENLEYDTGMAVTALNLDDFNSNERLFVEQMVEPIIMDGTSIVKMGSVILGRRGK